MPLIHMLFFLACSSDDSANTSKPAPTKEFGKVDVADLEQIADEVEVIPSPLKMREQLSKASINVKLGEYVSKRDLPDLSMEDKSRVAINTGVLLTDLVLTVETAEAAQLTDILKALKTGFATLQTGNDIQVTLDDLLSTVQGEDLNREALLSELDLLSSVIVPELKSETGAWAVPLIQAGAWLEGVNIISKVVQDEKKYSEGGALFHHPGIAPYFIRYLKQAGDEKFTASIVDQTVEALNKLDSFGKKKTLSEDEVNEVQKITSELISFI